MKRFMRTKKGLIHKELTSSELNEFALAGDIGAKIELLKQNNKAPESIEERLSLIEEYLGWYKK